MDSDPSRPRFHPSSPVQPDRSSAPYFAAAIAIAFGLWAFQQYPVQDETPASRSDARQSSTAGSSAPSSGDLRALFRGDDYPFEAQLNSEQGTVRAALDVDTKGRVQRCSIIRSSGHASLDQATCRILEARARFTPAHGANGSAVPSRVMTPPISWRLEG